MPAEEALVGEAAVAPMRIAFQTAAEAAGAVHQFQYMIAGRCVRLRVVGDRLAAELALPFSHLASPAPAAANQPDLTIEVWDQEESGVPSGAKSKPADGRPFYRIEASSDGRYVCDERNFHVAWLDRRDGRIIAAIDSVDRLYLDERARPFRRLLSVWLDDVKVQLSHCGLVADGGQGVLFVGNQGAGKTTSSVACVLGGFDYLGDDFVGIGRDSDGRFIGHSVYASCLLDRGHLRRFGELQQYARAPHHAHEQKSVIYMADAFPERLAACVPLQAVVLPRVVDAPVATFRRARAAEALLALAPTGVMFLTSPGAPALDMLGDLVSETRCYHLELGRDVTTTATAVAGLLEEARS